MPRAPSAMRAHRRRGRRSLCSVLRVVVSAALRRPSRRWSPETPCGEVPSSPRMCTSRCQPWLEVEGRTGPLAEVRDWGGGWDVEERGGKRGNIWTARAVRCAALGSKAVKGTRTQMSYLAPIRAVARVASRDSQSLVPGKHNTAADTGHLARNGQERCVCSVIIRHR